MQNRPLLPIAQIISGSLPPNIDFKPKRNFYRDIGINKHRFAKIMKGVIDPTRSELQSISMYFHISIELFL